MKYGSKYVSLKEDDPYTVTLERALEVIRLKQEADANRIIADFGVDNIQVLNGRYGPYITDGKKNAKVPKDRDPKSVTLEECRTLLAQAPERGKGRWGRGRRGAAAPKPAAAKARARSAPAAPPACPRAATPGRASRSRSRRRAAARARLAAERSNGNGAKPKAPAAAPPPPPRKPAKKKAAPRKAARKHPSAAPAASNNQRLACALIRHMECRAINQGLWTTSPTCDGVGSADDQAEAHFG